MNLGGESQGKELRRVHAYIPNQIPKRKASKPPQEISQEKVPKITKSSIHTMKVHTRFSLPPDHPAISKDLTMKLSS
jgi:hypothetical protein